MSNGQTIFVCCFRRSCWPGLDVFLYLCKAMYYCCMYGRTLLRACSALCGRVLKHTELSYARWDSGILRILLIRSIYLCQPFLVYSIVFQCPLLCRVLSCRVVSWLALPCPACLPVSSDLVSSRLCLSSQVTGHKGAEEMATALDGADIVVIPAGVPRKPGMTR